MKRPQPRKQSKKDRVIAPPPDGIELEAVAARVRYTGSAYHKDSPSFSGPLPPPRADATICPRELEMRQGDIQDWLRHAIRSGQFGADWRQGLPHHVWHREGDVLYEACLTNSGAGEYHGYPLEPDAVVRGLA